MIVIVDTDLGPTEMAQLIEVLVTQPPDPSLVPRADIAGCPLTHIHTYNNGF